MTESDPPGRKSPRLFRRFWRLMLWISIAGILLSALTFVLVLKNPEFVLRQVLRRIAPDLSWRTGSLQLDLRHGSLTAEGIEASIKNRFEFAAEGLSVEGDLWRLGMPALSRVRMRGGTLTVEILPTPAGSSSSNAGQPNGAGLSADVQIDGLFVRAKLPDGASATGTINLTWDQMSAPTKPASVTVRSFELRPSTTAQPSSFDHLNAELAVTGKDTDLRAITLTGADLHINDSLLSLIDRFTSKQKPEAANKPTVPAFSVANVRISESQVTLDASEFPKLSTQISVRPDENGEVHRITFSKLKASAAEAFAESWWAIDAESLEITGRPVALARLEIDAVQLRDAAIQLNPWARGEHRDAPPPRQGQPQESTEKWDPQIHLLSIENTRFEFAGDGAVVPSVRGNIEVFTEDINIGAIASDENSRIINLGSVEAAFETRPPFLKIPKLQLKASFSGLHRQRLEHLFAPTMELVLDAETRVLLTAKRQSDSSAKAQDSSQTSGWAIDLLELPSNRIALTQLGGAIPDISFTSKIVLSDIPLNNAPSAAADQQQRIELSNFRIVSPLDPFASVLTFRSVFIDFTLSGLLRSEIESVTLIEPTIYAGPDLFWYADEFQRQSELAEANGPADPAVDDADTPQGGWTINRFKAAYGRLAISMDGAARLALPIEFESSAENVHFDDLKDLRVKLDVRVPVDDYLLPSYQLELLSLGGRLDFGLPPESNASNLVNTLEVRKVRWRQFEADKAWLSVTYDRRGIYGELGGESYAGYINGGFSFFLEPGFPWTGWASATAFDLAAFTKILAPESVLLSGLADGKVEINATGPRIDRMLGHLAPRGGGELEITKIDELLRELPAEWGSLKKSLTEVGLGALRDFPYDTGRAEFWFLERAGQISLDLRGPTGSRFFDVRVHETDLIIPDKRPINLRMNLQP